MASAKDRPARRGGLERAAAALFEDAAEREAFLEAMRCGESREQALIVLDARPEIAAFPKMRPLPWQPDFVVRTVDPFLPTRHPLYEQGAFYPLDFSSVFAAVPMLSIEPAPERILDLCAAPGGKAIFAWRAFRDRVPGGPRLVANETIRKRAGMLIENLRRCRVTGAFVATADPSVWGRKAPEAFDLVIVDAPCSGQSLLAKGREAPGCWSPAMIDMNHSRQRRILGHAARCLRPGGHLLYMTCTFSRKENEKVVSWLVEEYPDFEPVEVEALSSHRSRFAEFPCYRLFPHEGLGAGAFTCLLRRSGNPPAHRPPWPEGPWRWTAEEDSRRPQPAKREFGDGAAGRRPARRRG